MAKKKKILMLSDHALSTSGVGTQSRHLIEGLLKKGEWTVRQFGAAMKHENYDVQIVNEDFIIKPTDGFGNRELIRTTLASEKPDVLFIFTDPRFFIWLFEMEDEVHQICPIVWWHVWDNHPFPEFNSSFYDATDTINCHSHMTYELLKTRYPEKTNFIPHSVPEEVFYPLSEQEKIQYRSRLLGENNEDNFLVFWMNRNARRKRPGDLLWSWKLFLDQLEEKYGKKNARLLMHADPLDPEGPNLYAIVEELGIKDNVIFSMERVGFEEVNIMHNISDCCINISYAEGFGLCTLESMQTGTPIIAVKTGGLTRQVVDHRDGSENGVALDVDIKTLVGSQHVPYIYEDYCSVEKIADALLTMYEKSPDEKKQLGNKVRDYVLSEFSYQKTVDDWHDSLNKTIENWKSNYDRWVCEEF